MSKKAIILVVMVLVMVMLAISTVFYFTQSRPTTNQPPAGQPLKTFEALTDDRNNGKVVQDDRIIIPANGGGVVINNVFKNAQFFSDERYLSYKITDEIQYSSGGSSEGFVITTQGSPDSMLLSEKKFLQLLGISKVDACKLSVQEYITSDNEPSIYKDTLSFCNK